MMGAKSKDQKMRGIAIMHQGVRTRISVELPEAAWSVKLCQGPSTPPLSRVAGLGSAQDDTV